MNLFDILFWKDFISNGLATLLGAIAGIPIALGIDRWRARRRKREEIRQDTLSNYSRQLQLLDLVEEALDKNKKLVLQMKEELSPDTVIYYNVDTLLLDSISSLKYEIFDYLEFNRLLDSIRYELSHLHRKVELQLEIEYSLFAATEGYLNRRRQIIGAITGHFPRIEREIDEAKVKIQNFRVNIFSKYPSLKADDS